MAGPSPFPNPTITEMVADRTDLHVKIDALLKEFHQFNAGLRLEPTLRKAWDELQVDIGARLCRGTGTCDMADARLALGQLQDDILKVLRPFAKKYFWATLALSFEYINDDPQATLSLRF
jgi:hypothetical protein